MKFTWLLLPALVLATGPTPAPMPIPAGLMRILPSVPREILRLPECGVFDEIRFSVKGDTILLTGQASRPLLRSASEPAAGKIEGGERVENRIEVLPFANRSSGVRFGRRAPSRTQSRSSAVDRHGAERG